MLEITSLVTQKWSTPETLGAVPRGGRYGHSACVHNRSLVIFGGHKDILTYRECYNDVRVYHTNRNLWENLKTSGKRVEERRNHAATVYHNKMYVYGGINPEGEFLRDLWSFDFGKSFLSLCNKIKGICHGLNSV